LIDGLPVDAEDSGAIGDEEHGFVISVQSKEIPPDRRQADSSPTEQAIEATDVDVGLGEALLRRCAAVA
jgi:hypothetical protein